MKFPGILIFNYFTNKFLKQINSFAFINRRLKSMLIDFGFILFFFFPLFLVAIVTIIFIDPDFSNPINTVNLSSILISILFAIITFVMINKDFFSGRSIAKRIFGYRIIDNISYLPASEMQCMIRNITVIIWPLEVIFTLVNPDRRLGDLIAGTKLNEAEVISPETILVEMAGRDKTRKFGKLIWTSILIIILFNLITSIESIL